MTNPGTRVSRADFKRRTETIWIFADTLRDAELLRRSGDGDVRVVSDASDLPADFRRGDCLVVGHRSGSRRGKVEFLTEVGRRLAWLPIILVIDRGTSPSRFLGRAHVSAFVWFDDIQTNLQPRIESARRTTALAQVAATIRDWELPFALRTSLVHSLRQAVSQPVRTVTELADAVGRSRVTLSQQFRAHAGGATTFARYLSALVVLRAHQLRAAGLNWKAVSSGLGIRRETLNRKTRAWLGCPLSALERIPREQMLTAFVAEHVTPLLGENPRDPVDSPPEH